MPETKGTQANQSQQGVGQRSSQPIQRTTSQGAGQRELSRLESYGSGIWQDPLSLMNQFADEIDRLFENFGFGRSLGTRSLIPRSASTFGDISQGIWSPQIEVFEREGQFIVRADLPGLNKDDVKLEITDDALILQGERKQEHEENREGFYRSERSYGSFHRVIPLPEGVDAEKAKASFSDGVLEVVMPAPQRERRSRRIEIGGESSGTAQARAGAQTTSKQ